MRYAIVSSGVVANVIIADAPLPGAILLLPGQVVSPGDLYDGILFTHPPPDEAGNGQDDTERIDALLESGGRFPRGTFLTRGGHAISNNCLIQGMGMNATIFRRHPESAGAPLFQTAPDTHSFTLRDMQIDGGRMIGRGLSLNAFDYTLEHILVKECLERGVHADWQNASSASPSQLGLGPGGSHAYWHDVHVVNCGSAAEPEQVFFGGPHDSIMHVVEVFNHRGYLAGGVGMVLSAAGMQAHMIHVYQNHEVACRIEASGIVITNSQFESADTQLLIAAGNLILSACRIYGVPSNPRANKGIEFVNSSGGHLLTGLQIDHCAAGALRFTSGGGTSIIQARGFHSGAGPYPFYVGTPPVSSDLTFMPRGGYDPAHALSRRAA